MLDLLPLPLVFGVALAAAITDTRTGKIPNRLLIAALYVGAAWTAALAVWLVLGGPGQSSVMRYLGPWSYLGAVLLNAVLSFLICLALWWVGVWAAGDAKLFSLLAFLLPLGFYENNYLSGLPSFVLFFNTFLCLAALLATELTVRLILRVRRGALRQVPQWIATALARLRAQGLGVFRILMGFMAIFMMIRVLRHFARGAIDAVLPLNRTLVFVVLFVMFTPLIQFLSRPRIFRLACVAMVAYAVFALFIADDPVWRKALIEIGWKSVAIVALGGLYIAYTDFAETRPTTVGELRQGLLLSPSCLQALQENSEFNNEKMGVQGPDGLTAEQVETLQTWFVKNHPSGLEAPLERATTIPFAPAMLLGLAATVLLRGYILELN